MLWELYNNMLLSLDKFDFRDKRVRLLKDYGEWQSRMGWDKKKLGRYPKKIIRLRAVLVKYDFLVPSHFIKWTFIQMFFVNYDWLGMLWSR